MREFWGRHFLAAESLLAVGGAVAFGLWEGTASGSKDASAFLNGSQAFIYSTLATILGVLLGFAISVTAIAVTMNGNARLARIEHSDRYQQLGDVFRLAIPVLGLSTLACLVGLIADRATGPNLVVRDVAVAGLLLSFTSVARVAWILHVLIGLVTRPSQARRGDEP